MGTTAYGGERSKGRAANGDRPVGAASCRREQHTMRHANPPPPPWEPMGWATPPSPACHRRRFKGERPIGTTTG